MSFLTSIGPNLANKITLDNKLYLETLQNCESDKLILKWKKIDYEELEELVKDIDVSKNSNIENINTILLKDSFLGTLQVRHLFNLVLESGNFPDKWKTASVVPLFKSGNKSSVSNFRPISLLPCIAKLLEKIIHSRLYLFKNDTKFFTDAQCGFRPNMGTVDRLGVINDDRLKFDSHIKMIRQNFCSRMHTLKRVKYLLGVKNALLLYKGKMLPYLDQGDLFYDSANADQVSGLQTLQNHCLRIIYGKKSRTNICELHKKSKLLRLEC